MKIFNCPNCGAPISNEKCPYCGTVFYDFTVIDTKNPCYIKIKDENHIIMMKVIPKNIDIELTREYVDIYGETIESIQYNNRNNLDVNINFEGVIMDDDTLLKVVQI